MNQEEIIVLPDHLQAAERKTVTGWVSRNGHFWGEDERMARYEGSTHRACDVCGSVVLKQWVYCEKCRYDKMQKVWEAMPRKEWDHETPLAIFDTDTYFFFYDEIESYCEDHECKPEDLKLVWCDPIKPKHIYADDLFADELPGDDSEAEVRDTDILAAIDALNKAIERAEPFSWYPGKVAAILSTEPKTEATRLPDPNQANGAGDFFPGEDFPSGQVGS